jgi:phosphohistidine phosphatase SixA
MLGLASLSASSAFAQILSGGPLREALRKGGLVLVMRHANSPGAPPDAASANADNPTRERQLDETGRADSRTLGEAIRRVGVPIGEVLSSTTYRTQETARIAGLPAPRLVAELAEGGGQEATTARNAWLRAQTGQKPAAATNRLLITHTPNITGVFGTMAQGVAAGEILVFRPEEAGASTLIGRIKIADWAVL